MGDMGRPLRIDPAGGWHHVMNRGIDHGAIFFADTDRLEFGRLLGLVHDRFGVEIHAYCLMSNHYHLLLRCPDGGLSDSMHLLGTRFVQYVNDRLGRNGPLFKGRFHSRLIVDSGYLANVVRYVHLNPLDIPDVGDLAAYRWSSHRTYLGLRPAPSWLSIDKVLGWFHGDVEAYSGFVAAPLDTSPIRLPRTVDQLVNACGMVVAERSPSHPRSHHAEQRCLLLHLADHLGRTERAQIHESLGLAGDSVRTATARARRRFDEHPQMREMLDVARRLVADNPAA